MHVAQWEEFCRDNWVVPQGEALHDLVYMALGVAGEGGEVADEVKKLIREHGWEYNPSWKKRIGLELGDVLYYVTRLAQNLGYTLEEVMILESDKIKAKRAST